MLQSRIRRGELDRRITFIQPVLSTGISNEDKENGWEPVDTNPTQWARKKDLRGKEVMIGDQLHYIQQTIWTSDYREDITGRNRIVYNGKVYVIISITENGGDASSSRHRYIDFLTEIITTETYT